MSEGFQFKLYRLVSEGASGVTWSKVGDSIYIDVVKFKKFLSRDNTFCKSKNVTSFIRQLNLYGFKIVIDLGDENDKHIHSKNLKEYSNSYFLRGRFDLLHKITRNGRDIKLNLPRAAPPPLPTQNWGKRKRQITKQDQFNPTAKKIKQEVIDESYAPFERACPKIEQIDPVGKKIKQEKIDTSYEGIHSNFPPRVAFVKEEENPEYEEISTTLPYCNSTRTTNKTLASILKPATESTSKMTEDKNITRNGRSRRCKKNFKKLSHGYTENTENLSVVENSGELQSAVPAASPIKVSPLTPSPAVSDECTVKNEAKIVDNIPTPSKTMVPEPKIETDFCSDMDLIYRLTEEKFLQFELECISQLKMTNVLTNSSNSDVSHGKEILEVEEVVVLDEQNVSKNTVDASINKDHLYAKRNDEEINENMVMEEFMNQAAGSSLVTPRNQEVEVITIDAEVILPENQEVEVITNDAEENQANADEEDDFDLLPWRKRPPSSYLFPSTLPRYKSDYEYPCPLQICNPIHAVKALREDTTEPISKSESENLDWSSSLYRNREAFERAIVYDYFRIGYDKPCVMSNEGGVPKPKTLQEVLNYKIKM